MRLPDGQACDTDVLALEDYFTGPRSVDLHFDAMAGERDALQGDLEHRTVCGPSVHVLKRQRLIHRVARDYRAEEVFLVAVAQRREVIGPLFQLDGREEALAAAWVRGRRNRLNSLTWLHPASQPVHVLIGGRRVDTNAVELDGRRRIKDAFGNDVDSLLLAVNEQAQVVRINVGIKSGGCQLRLSHPVKAFALYSELGCRLCADDSLDRDAGSAHHSNARASIDTRGLAFHWT